MNWWKAGNYLIEYNPDCVDYHGDEIAEVAKIVDLNTDEPIIFAYYDKNLYQEKCYHFCISIYDIDGKEYPVAMVDDYHRQCLYENLPVFMTMMLHELGHYCNGDITSRPKPEEESKRLDEEHREDRTQAILNNRIVDAERKADLFAAKIVGKNVFMRTMDYMYKKRKERPDDPDKNIALKEFELRKKAIQNCRF